MFRRWLINTVILISLASTASADFCVATQNVLTYEALLASNDNRTTELLNQLYATAASLERLARAHRPPVEGSALEAVQNYVQSINRIQSAAAQNTLQSSVMAHQSGLHRVKTRYLRSFSDLICNDPPNSVAPVPHDGTPAPANRGFVSPVRNGLNYAVNLVLFFVVLTVSIVALITALYVRKKRLALRVRHYCHVSATVRYMGGGFDTHLVDISAIGLKIELPEGQSLPTNVVVDFFDTSAQAKVAWKNASFVGLTVHPPLSLDLVASVSKGEIAWEKSKARHREKAAAGT